MEIRKIKLAGKFVKLDPLESRDIDELCQIGLAKEIWRWYPFEMKSRRDMESYVEDALRNRKLKTELPFVIIDRSLDNIVGSTRFMNIDTGNKRAEIGSTWLNPKWQRTYINTETKLLMLTHAFEIWKCIRVELKTDALNQQSRRAILRIGASEEGVLRQHMITKSGRFRDTVYYSIINSEWPEIKAGLKKKLGSY
jgi:RimJ/RimL family protein N-acetyltransferase